MKHLHGSPPWRVRRRLPLSPQTAQNPGKTCAPLYASTDSSKMSARSSLHGLHGSARMRACVRASVSVRARVRNTRVHTCVKGRVWAQFSAGRHSDATNWTFQLPELQVPAGHRYTDGIMYRLWDVSKPGLQRSSVRIRCHSAGTSGTSNRTCKAHQLIRPRR